MNNFLILQPTAVLALFTLMVLLLIPVRAFMAQFAKQLALEADFKFGVPVAAPVRVSLLNRNYMNLLEAPLLFYVASIVIFVTNKTDKAFLYLAWAFVALRVIHSAIHLTYNGVLHRGLVFALGASILTIMWIRILLTLW